MAWIIALIGAAAVIIAALLTGLPKMLIDVIIRRCRLRKAVRLAADLKAQALPEPMRSDEQTTDDVLRRLRRETRVRTGIAVGEMHENFDPPPRLGSLDDF
jgi:class 3 adenylate cyclase